MRRKSLRERHRKPSRTCTYRSRYPIDGYCGILAGCARHCSTESMSDEQAVTEGMRKANTVNTIAKTGDGTREASLDWIVRSGIAALR